MIRTQLIEETTSLARLRDEWRELVSESQVATPFQTWEWQDLWFKHYGFGKRRKTLVIWEGDDLIGIAPFVAATGSWRSLRWAGGGPSDYLHPISRNGYEEVVAKHVSEYLNSTVNIDFIDLHQVRETRFLAEAFRPTIVLDQATCLVLDLPNTFDDYLKTLGKSLRYDVRKLDKDLFTSGKASMETSGLEQVGVSFEIFLEQHRARWRERKLPGAFIGKSLRFHREWVVVASQHGWLKLKILRYQGTPVGAIYAMSFNDTLYYYQAGFDPAHKAISPGTLLVADSIRTGIEEGVTHFDFMRGDEPYKRRWKPQNEFHNRRLMLNRGSPQGNAALSWNVVANRLEMKVRSRLEGGGGS